MRKHVLHALLSLMVIAALVVFLAYWFWPEISAPVASAGEKGTVVGLTFAFRRLQRPLWSFLTVIGIIRFLGYATYGYYRRLITRPIRMLWMRIYEHWLHRSAPVKVLHAGLLFTFASSLFYFLTFNLGTTAWMWIVIEKFYLWLGDRLIDHGLYYWRIEYWIERTIHTVPWLRRALAAPRHYLAVLKRNAETKRNEARHRARELREQDARVRAETERW